MDWHEIEWAEMDWSWMGVGCLDWNVMGGNELNRAGMEWNRLE